MSTAHPGFYQRLTPTASEMELDLTALVTSDGQPCGYSLTVRTGPVVHNVDTGFDQRAAHLSPGVVLLSSSVKEAIEAGFRLFDLGEYAEYKQRYQPEIAPGIQIRAQRSTSAIWGRLAGRLHQ